MSYLDIVDGKSLENTITEKDNKDKETIKEKMELKKPQPPKKVFIVPYRGRPEQKFFFCKYMNFILENKETILESPKETSLETKEEKDYEIYFSHQYDNRSFNRGATKNIGFLAVKEKYPDDYHNITFIFNDIDTVPFHNIFTYDTTPGVVKHYYGFEYALGGIVVIKGSDFELINGYPCLWGWGMEDTVLQRRCLSYGIQIDRSDFYPIGSPEVLQLFDGVDRLMNKRDPKNLYYDDGEDGLRTIKNLYYTLDKRSKNENDNLYLTIDNSQIFIVNIYTFLTRTRYEQSDIVKYDMRRPMRSMKDMERLAVEQKIQRTNPAQLQQYKNTQPVKRVTFEEQAPQLLQKRPNFIPNPNIPIPNPQTVQNPNINPNYYKSASYIFSAQYAQQVGQKARATTSASIGLGGIIGVSPRR
jgi:hypothetical protein